MKLQEELQFLLPSSFDLAIRYSGVADIFGFICFIGDSANLAQSPCIGDAVPNVGEAVPIDRCCGCCFIGGQEICQK